MSADQRVADRIEAMQTNMATQGPAEAHQVFDRERELQATRSPENLPALGAAMPDGDLLDAHGAPTSLGAARAGRAAVVVFYRGAWCPYCNTTLRAYQELLLPELTPRGVALIAVSPQAPDGSLTMQETNALEYAVLADPGNQIAGALGILTETGAEALALVAAGGLDIAATNADGTGAIPMPTVVIVDAVGAIRWIDVHPDYATRTEPTEILKRVAELG